jgi:branched-chain amino acid transport system permease protein
MEQAIINGLSEGSVYAVLAVGLVFIHKITEVANFAQGELGMVATFVGFSLFQWLGLPLALVFLGSIVFGAVMGYAVERCAVRPALASGILGTTIVTLGLYFFLHGGAAAIWGPEVHTFPSFFDQAPMSVSGVLVSKHHASIMAVSLLTALGLSAFLRWTDLGLAMRAVPQNRIGARIIGLDLKRLYMLTWVLGSAMSAMAGLLLAPVMFLNTNMMVGPLIKAFAAAVLGGLDSLLGAFVGGLLLGLIENIVVMYLSSDLKDSLAFVFILVVLVVQPRGLFGRVHKAKV